MSVTFLADIWIIDGCEGFTVLMSWLSEVITLNKLSFIKFVYTEIKCLFVRSIISNQLVLLYFLVSYILKNYVYKLDWNLKSS